jgi:hypothetical protein
MIKLKKVQADVKLYQHYTFNGVGNGFFTKGRGDYRIDGVSYDSGTNSQTLFIIDDNGDNHEVSDNYLTNFFSLTLTTR